MRFTLKQTYLLLCVLGTILPYSYFIPFLFENGLDIPLFFSQLFANQISSFFGWDVIVSAIVLILFIIVEGQRQKIERWWIPVAGTCTVGVSLGLPLFLYLREVHREKAS